MHLMNLAIWFLRLGPLGLGAIAACIFAAGFFLQVEANKAQARENAALASGMPPAVDIDRFDQAQHRTAVGEVHIRAQAHLDAGYDMTLEKNIGEDRAYMVPLLAPESTSPEVIGVALWTSRDFEFTDLNTPQIFAKADQMGAFGPVTRFNGRLRGLGDWDEITRDALRDEGLTLANDAVIVWPYLEGRHVALAPAPPSEMSIFGILSKIGGAVALLALLKIVIRPSARPEEDALDILAGGVSAQPVRSAGADMFDGIQTTVAAPAEFSQQNDQQNAPLWKQRLDARLTGATSAHDAALLEEEWAPEAPAVQPAYVAPEPQALTAERPRRGLGLRKALVFVVGGAFVLLLVATLWGVIGDTIKPSGGTNQAAIVDPAVLNAQRIAQELIPSRATPSDATLSFDVTAIAQWFVVKGILALSGDKVALALLTAIIGGVLLSGFLLRYFFLVRRMFQPKLSPDIANMGFN